MAYPFKQSQTIYRNESFAVVQAAHARNESLERWNDVIKRTTDNFLAFGRACSKTLASISPLLLKAMQEQLDFERGPTIGRKRRARRARGRRRGNA
jgi:hypothetical protein